MALTAQTSDGLFVIPGAYVSQKVESPNSGVSTTGVIMLVGESDAGPAFDEETDITQNFYGPDALASVSQKYKSGPIVDAFKLAAQAANDPNIQGSPARIYIAKTNVSPKANTSLLRSGLTAYGSLYDKSYGELGNLISAAVSAAPAEVAPTTGSFTYVPAPAGMIAKIRVNGGTAQTLTIGAKTSPASLVGTVESTAGQSFNSTVLSGLNYLHATGGLDRVSISAAMRDDATPTKIAIAVSGNDVVISVDTGVWAVTPVVGDTLIIPATGEYGAIADSVIKGATSKNLGVYVVTAATTTSVSATKIRDNASTTNTAPEAVAATDITHIYDILVYSPIVVQNMTGTERAVLSAGLVGQTVTGTATGQSLSLVLQTGAVWGCLPQAGDVVLMPVGAPAAWRATNTNGGWYQVTSATSGVGAGASTLVMTRLSNGAPASFVATAIGAVTDLRVFRPAIDGVGKSLEIYDGAGAESIAVAPYKFLNLSTSAVSWVSTAVSAQVLTSASEYQAQLDLGRQLDSISESLLAGGDIMLRIGYHGGGTVTTATATVSTVSGVPHLTTTVSGGSGANLDLDLTKYRTLSDVAAFVNAQTGYKAVVGSALFGQQPTCYSNSAGTKLTVLDKASWGIASANGGYPGRLKKDGYDFALTLSQGSQLSQLGNPIAAATAGLPEVQAIGFFSGASRGVTTDARVALAVDAMEKVRGNFLVPLFSRDASADSAEGLTDVSSAYTIDGINAYAKSHVLALSSVKRRRHRQALLSKRCSFTDAKLAANNLASARCTLCFQDFKAVGVDGSIKQFHPWAGAVLAAGMQAAGFYKPIVKKFINCTGVLSYDGSYSDQLTSQVEDALLNGLLVAEQSETGGFRWVSDGTTYCVDNNFVYSSLQAVYGMDTVSLTIAQRMENAFVGQSLADVSAGVMLSFLSGIMRDLKRLKLIASSDDAPAGYKDASIQIAAPSAMVSLNVKLSTGLYFVLINSYFTAVTQSASQ
jgi:hypothetical protein